MRTVLVWAVYRAVGLNAGRIVAVKQIGLEGQGSGNCVVYAGSLPGQAVVAPYPEGMAMDEKTSRYTVIGPLRQTVKGFGKVKKKLVTGFVFGILEGPDQGPDFLHRSDIHRKILW